MAGLCLTLTGRTLKENLRFLENASPELAELRVDFLAPGERELIPSFPAAAKLPLILTCRKTADGGQWDGSDEERERFLLSCLEGGFDYLDLEEDDSSAALEKDARRRGVRIIRSLHDFSGVPADLEERLTAMDGRGDLVKAAVMPRGIADLTRLFRIGRDWKRDNLILLGMGEYGVPSRILADRMGSCLTFCSPPGESAAPGHMSWETLHDLYRVPSITSQTALYGIIGRPVLHSRSPGIHNPGLAEAGLDGVYLPFTVDDTDAFFELAEFLDIRGFSVTVPHKEAVIRRLNRISDAVRSVGACNTVVREGEDWAGYNTDVRGFIAPLTEMKGPLEGQTAAVIGAGGAARSAVYALMNEGCRVTVFNRTVSRAESLAEDMGCRAGSLEDFLSVGKGDDRFDLIIQTTSAGMEGKEGPDNPIPQYGFSGSELLYDIIYTPAETPVMRKAREAGCDVLGGWPMLVEQAREQFRLFTGETLNFS